MSAKRIHIVGLGPRTGTTLMAEAMISGFDIAHHTPHEDRLFVPHPGGDGVFLTKHPADLFVVGPSLCVDPDLYVICMMRDPRDAVVSRHGKDPDTYWAGLRYWKTFFPHWRRLRRHPRFFSVRYEDLVTDPDAVQEHLLEKMPFLEKTAAFSRFHETARPSGSSVEALQGIRPIAAQSIGKWRDHLPRVCGQMEIHGSLADELIEADYETDRAWMQVLEGVELDKSPSHWPEHFSWWERAKRRRGKWLHAARRLLRRFF